MEENKYTDEFFEKFEQRYKKSSESDSLAKHKRVKRNNGKKIALCLTAVVLVIAIVLMIVLLGKQPNSLSGNENAIKGADIIENVPNEPEEPVIINPYVEPDENTVSLAADVNSEYAVLIERETGRIVGQRNYDSKVYPASLTKIMTLLVAVEENKDLNATFEMTFEIIDPLYRQEASLAGFTGGEKVKVIDLMYGAILPSGADATCGLAIHTAGSEAAFVELMNKKVQQLGLKNTHFANTSGLHDPQNYTTVYDMAIILKAASENELAKEILSTYQYTTNPTPEHPDGILLTSTLFSRMYGTEPKNGAVIEGGKTGFINESGNCIASYGTSQSGKEYIFVSCGAKGLWKAVFDHINTYAKYVN